MSAMARQSTSNEDFIKLSLRLFFFLVMFDSSDYTEASADNKSNTCLSSRFFSFLAFLSIC